MGQDFLGGCACQKASLHARLAKPQQVTWPRSGCPREGITQGRGRQEAQLLGAPACDNPPQSPVTVLASQIRKKWECHGSSCPCSGALSTPRQAWRRSLRALGSRVGARPPPDRSSNLLDGPGGIHICSKSWPLASSRSPEWRRPFCGQLAPGTPVEVASA